jgi:hypothetical protein
MGRYKSETYKGHKITFGTIYMWFLAKMDGAFIGEGRTKKEAFIDAKNNIDRGLTSIPKPPYVSEM